MAKSETRVITKWKKKYKELESRRRTAISSCIVHKRLDERIKDIKNKLIAAGVNVAEIC